MLSASIGEGFPYADVAAHGHGVRRDRRRRPRSRPAAARERLARLAWEMREQCDAIAPDPGRGDRPGARRPRSAPGRPARRRRQRRRRARPATRPILLEALIRNRVPSFLCPIWDAGGGRARPRTVGARVDLEVGGKTDAAVRRRRSGSRAPTRAVGQDAWEDRKASGGWVSFDAGLGHASSTSTAAARSCSRRRPCPAAGAGQYAALGVDAADHRIIVSKAVYSTRDGYPMAQRLHRRSTRPGSPPSNMTRFTITTGRGRCSRSSADATYD